MIESCVMCVVIERAWANSLVAEPRIAVLHVNIDGAVVVAHGLTKCPCCGDDRGPPAWCGDAYQDEAHSDDVAAAEQAWRERLAA